MKPLIASVLFVLLAACSSGGGDAPAGPSAPPAFAEPEGVWEITAIENPSGEPGPSWVATNLMTVMIERDAAGDLFFSEIDGTVVSKWKLETMTGKPVQRLLNSRYYNPRSGWTVGLRWGLNPPVEQQGRITLAYDPPGNEARFRLSVMDWPTTGDFWYGEATATKEPTP